VRILVAATLAVATAAAILFSINLSSPEEASAAKRTPTPTRTRTASPSPTPTRTPIPSPSPAIGPGIMVAECAGTASNSARVFFLWTPSRAGGQWLDLSAFNNGFAPGTFLSAGAFAPDRWGYIWGGLSEGTTHYARVNTYTSEGWKPSATLAFYTPVCSPGGNEPAPAADMVALQQQLGAAVYASGFNAAVAITDLRTGETIDVNGYDTRLPGCTINLFALMRVAVDLQHGRYPEPQAGDLIGQTINRSDPITSRQLVKYWVGDGDLYTGLTRVNEFIASLGMGGTLLDHPPAYPQESLYGGLSNRITARDANKGLQGLWDGRVLEPGWRDYMLQKMTLVKPGLNYLIPAGVGYGATASHKNGFLYEEGWADNDIGIVWFERGGERYGYAISFFTQNVRNKYDDIPLGQNVSRLAYQWFVGRYGYP
jgi:beta-lactamase class A